MKLMNMGKKTNRFLVFLALNNNSKYETTWPQFLKFIIIYFFKDY